MEKKLWQGRIRFRNRIQSKCFIVWCIWLLVAVEFFWSWSRLLVNRLQIGFLLWDFLDWRRDNVALHWCKKTTGCFKWISVIKKNFWEKQDYFLYEWYLLELAVVWYFNTCYIKLDVIEDNISRTSIVGTLSVLSASCVFGFKNRQLFGFDNDYQCWDFISIFYSIFSVIIVWSEFISSISRSIGPLN